MKKTYDWSINLDIWVSNMNKKLKIVCSVHTTVHRIKIEIAKKLKLQVYDTEMDLMGGKEKWRPMKSTSSLYQNGIEKSACITAILTRTIQNKKLDPQISEENNHESDCPIGLQMVASCTNEHCTNYCQDIHIYLGFGTFQLLPLISDLKCEKCPYKSQYMRPNMMCKQMKIGKCIFKVSGTSWEDGIPKSRQTKYLKVSESKDMKKFMTEKCSWGQDLRMIIQKL